MVHSAGRWASERCSAVRLTELTIAAEIRGAMSVAFGSLQINKPVPRHAATARLARRALAASSPARDSNITQLNTK